MISQAFHDYQRVQPAGGRFDRCSPALKALASAASEHWAMSSLGCYGVRPVRGGELASSHSYGAAIDLTYRVVGRRSMLDNVLPYLIGWSAEWGIQAIHDYVGCRIWRSNRTSDVGDACSWWWKAQRPDANGMGSNWATYLHIEVHPNAWADARTEAERLPIG